MSWVPTVIHTMSTAIWLSQLTGIPQMMIPLPAAHTSSYVCSAMDVSPAALLLLVLRAAVLSKPDTFTVWPLDSCLNSSSLMVSRSAEHPPALAVLT